MEGGGRKCVHGIRRLGGSIVGKDGAFRLVGCEAGIFDIFRAIRVIMAGLDR